ncbi:flagellar hook-length control protein FliK [Bradyrhizobium sp. AUGA SZCCT0431]|uniref:flagellar hook-length control protein FliK n=1 Tax=Bradyrhizobium sp. AUGA SZCCT0431 TaxID=2807674 RepID=UPI001BA8016A|nr:flagellar hook-length control protein FliK [Bradyrhizobium sp. AUGA SZCCT0431]MBR1144859.1 flagellar hook-length control protein FliK [Bradyrhizobium sp. AUGA SZCCT0431]
MSFQGATARSGRPDSDLTAGNDSFAALVDSNKAAANSDHRSQDTAPRRADDSQSPADHRARDNTAASDKAASDKAASDKAARNDARQDSSGRDVGSNARDNAEADTTTDATRRSKPKSDSSMSDISKPEETKAEGKPASGEGAAATDQTEAKQDTAALVTASAVASVIPVAAATAEASIAKAPTDTATAPLAVAAAAIAATASLTGAAAPAADASANPAATANAAKTEGAKIDAQTEVSLAVTAQAAPADTTLTSGIALAASAAATAAGVSKTATQARTPVVAKEGTATSGEPDKAAGTIAAPAAPAPGTIVPSVTPQAEVAGQPKAENGVIDPAKADVAGNGAPAPSAHAATHAHPVTADVSQTLLSASNNGLQAAGAIQTQQPASSTTPAPVPQLNVAVATSAAVPLSGLAMEIAASAKSGKSRFEIRLDPAELGRIDVRIDVDRNGQVTSHLTVERPETLSMLRQDANQLQRALDNAGLSTGNSGLQFSLRDQSSQGQSDGNQSNPNAHRLVVSEEDSIPAAVAGRNYGRMLGASGGVDIRV